MSHDETADFGNIETEEDPDTPMLNDIMLDTIKTDRESIGSHKALMTHLSGKTYDCCNLLQKRDSDRSLLRSGEELPHR